MEDIVIIDALRTPIGKYRGQLAQFSAVELGSAVSRALLAKNKKVGPLVDQAIFGNVLQAGNGQNPARQIVINSGLAPTVYATTVNQVCGSGMKAVSLAMEAIRLQKAELILAGGIESMSQAPFLSRYNQQKDSYSDPVPVMIKDGLTDAFSGQHMGLTAENVAQKFHVSRKEQDVLALYSQQKAAAAQEKGYFTAEKINLQTKEGKDINCDEGIRKATSLEKLAALKTVFKEDGTVTAGNASTLNDGAAAMLLASKNFALSQKLPILAEIKDIVEVGIDPSLMGISPIKAIRKLIAATEISLADIDWFEINEAFAASSIVVQRELALAAEKVNPVGSGISIGHAIGATGARIITTACHQLERIKGRYAIASLCVGGGLGLACLIERPSSQEKKHFYQMSKTQRLSQLALQKELSQDQLKDLTQTSLNDQVADHLIENQISEFELPMGVALNLRVNQKDYVVPMATEEPSVIAACSNGAKMLRTSGGLTSRMKEKKIRGQIVLQNVKDRQQVRQIIGKHEQDIFSAATKAYPSIVARGGGLKKIEIRDFAADPAFLSVDLIIDTKDAMGANIVNTILEAVAGIFKEYFTADVLMSILSNYTTEAMIKTTGSVSFETLGKGDKLKGKQIAQKIVAAAEFARLDVYRATTHNKGIMNGIEAVVLATGNDSRAVNSAVHAYAAEGGYHGLSQWEISDQQLIGTLELPLALATAGGATKILPKAAAALAILAVKDARELAEVVAAVGLAQNLAALRALVTQGIQKGHMALQARTLAVNAGARGTEVEKVVEKLQQTQINSANAHHILAQIRQQQ